MYESTRQYRIKERKKERFAGGDYSDDVITQRQNEKTPPNEN